MKENINALDEMNKGATMGIDAITFIIEKVEDEEFKEVLQEEKDKYKAISNKINEIYPKYNSEDTPHETNAMNKAMTWYGIEMKTFLDKSNSKIAELLIKDKDLRMKMGKNGRKYFEKECNVEESVKIIESYVEECKKNV